MNMPGFTADASLDKASEHYPQRSASAAVGAGDSSSTWDMSRRITTQLFCRRSSCSWDWIDPLRAPTRRGQS